ncbi:predicted protein [Botrytis cinerea T4]|uniref:Uncharacterized protein n=1 Tax=Botryotinia fuckeliana (strain T4) TaxID=999810 RepID=G2XRI7_BOTF4|nr:predicted protein [Botrytis cinerea T4]
MRLVRLVRVPDGDWWEGGTEARSRGKHDFPPKFLITIVDSRLVESDFCGLVRPATNHIEIRPSQFRSPIDFQISTTLQKLGSCSMDRGLFKASAKQEPKHEVNFFNSR